MNEIKKEAIEEKKKKLAKGLDNLKKRYLSKEPSKSLQIIGPLIAAFSSISLADTLKNKSASFLMGLNIATIGIEKEQSSLGFIGKTFNTILEDVLNYLDKLVYNKDDLANQKLFKETIKILFIGAIIFTKIIEETKLTTGRENFKDTSEEQRIQFEFEILLLMILNSGIIEDMIGAIANCCEINGEKNKLIAESIKGALLFVIILAQSKNNKIRFKNSIIDLKKHLIKALNCFEKLINEKQENKTFLNQALIALQEEDFDSFYEIYVRELGLNGHEEKNLIEDLEEIEKVKNIITDTFKKNSISRNAAIQMI